MVVYCFVEGCKSSRYKKVKENIKILLTFCRFPKNPILRKKWEEALVNSGHTQERIARITECSQICSLHFTKNSIKTIGSSYRQLKPNSVPTIFPNASKGSTADIESIESSIKLENDASVKLESVGQCEEETYETPSEKPICYADDVKSEEIKNISPETLIKIKSIQVSKRSCDKKNETINRLTIHQYGQKKKVESSNMSSVKLESVGRCEEKTYETPSKKANLLCR